MTHPILILQGRLAAALRADAGLVALLGPDGVFESPPKGRVAPYLVIARHDTAPRDGDGTPGLEHRLVLHAWSDGPSRRTALAIAERVLAVALGADLGGGGLLVTHCRHERTETLIDGDSGQARALIALRFHTEAVA